MYRFFVTFPVSRVCVTQPTWWPTIVPWVRWNSHCSISRHLRNTRLRHPTQPVPCHSDASRPTTTTTSTAGYRRRTRAIPTLRRCHRWTTTPRGDRAAMTTWWPRMIVWRIVCHRGGRRGRRRRRQRWSQLRRSFSAGFVTRLLASSPSYYYLYYYFFKAHQHKAAGRKTRLDIQNYGCNGNLLCYHGIIIK